MNYSILKLTDVLLPLFILLYNRVNVAISNSNFQIISNDKFPHNIDQDFSIKFHHPSIRDHHIYSVIMVRVNPAKGSAIGAQTLYLYPGHTDFLNRRLKEPLFHVMNFTSDEFHTTLFLRFYRESHDGELSIGYSERGAEFLHLRSIPSDMMTIYRARIAVYHQPSLELVMESADGHRGGLSLRQRATARCWAADGFPRTRTVLEYASGLRLVTPAVSREDFAELEFEPSLKDHMKNVTCRSGGTRKSQQIKIFHHASSVEIFPNKSYMKQGSSLECRSHGGGYPLPNVSWHIPNLNKTSATYFNISSTTYISYLNILPTAPNNSKWLFNCSSINIIPHLDHSGPFKIINVTIGVNPEAARLAAARIWTITFVSIILLIVFVIGLLCFGSKFSCRRSRSKNKQLETNTELSLQADYEHVNQEDCGDGDKDLYFKDQDCVV